MSKDKFKHRFKDNLREKFAKGLSKMYQSEVPQYKKLKTIVQAVNQQHQLNHPKKNHSNHSDIDGHGAIRLAHPEELFFLKRLFACFNLYPVDYYDLTASGIPVHSTAFRPIDVTSIVRNSFRIFTSLLRIDLINAKIQKKINRSLKKRNIISKELLMWIEKIEQSQSFNGDEEEDFINQTVDLFRFCNNAPVSEKTYQSFNQTHPLIADIASFTNPHINHLTLPTLDIDEVQKQMIAQSIKTKAIIEGPPKRKCPILLRQTAFLAVEEQVWFQEKNNPAKKGLHHARFGEIEQRGIALTHKGRELYDKLINQAHQQITLNADGSNQAEYQHILVTTFKAFPDDYNQIRQKKLAYFSYQRSKKRSDRAINFKNRSLDDLVESGWVDYQPIIYQDFLPISAAGIFHSNLGNFQNNGNEAKNSQTLSNQSLFEKNLGSKVHSQFDCYEKIQSQSIQSLQSHQS